MEAGDQAQGHARSVSGLCKEYVDIASQHFFKAESDASGSATHAARYIYEQRMILSLIHICS